MGGATIWPVPRAVDAEAHYYPRRWKRNVVFLYGGMFLIGIQLQRYGQLCRVSSSATAATTTYCFSLIISWYNSNQRCAQESTWTGAAKTHQSVLDTITELTLLLEHVLKVTFGKNVYI